MTRATPNNFPELRRVFSGYLHEDFLRESGSPEAAIRTFRSDASSAELRRFDREATQFVGRTAALDFGEVRRLLHQLGCRWVPPSREALVALLTGSADVDGGPEQ